ncbi:MAG: efflux RND transporter permease subunit [Bryobacter sp.]|nr:efflux RND transporter permease subunit [Bryobacter sp.]
MNPVRSSLHVPQVTLAVTLMIAVAGLWALLTMPRREDPKITIRVGLVAALYPGATSEQVEKQVIRPIEERLFRYEEVRKAKTYSTSRPGLAIVNVTLEDNVREPDKFWSKLRHDMNELRVRQLPEGVMGPVVDSDFGDTVAVLIAIHGPNYGYRELKEFAEHIEDQLRTLRATSKIKRFGEQKEQILVTGSLERIAQYGLSPAQVVQALQSRNTVQFAGRFETGNMTAPIETSGLFQSADQIKRLMIGVSNQTGTPIYLGDLANVERRYQDPDQTVRYRGEPALLISVEMQEGYNIVDFGHHVQREVAEARKLLPPDVQLDLIANQPGVVEERVVHFFREFGIAIGSVIIVTLLLLPFRVALIAALAIPITILVTFGALNAARIELHQVSIAALIVVLGMVVDDAIVIADNYVELLDRKVPRPEAAWRAATELAVPVLTATLTIIASFLPLILLSGSVGEFIFALPVTVAIALACSYVVAMMLTPLLCRRFIQQGLHDHASESKQSRGVLDRMQLAYNHTIAYAMRHKAQTAAFGVAAVAGGLLLLLAVPERFMPPAERDQFVIDVWLPEGTRYDRTDEVVRRIERHLQAQPLVRDYASFLGASAPRFYYNVDPQQPAANYAQLLVNTKAERETPAFVFRLRDELRSKCPEARVIVKELEQGEIISAPVEVRVSGEDQATLKSLAQQVQKILAGIPGSAYVHHDWREDSYQVKVDVNNEIANRTGFTNLSIARQLAGSIEGAPVSTFWEGDRAVDIVLRLEESRRQSFDNLRSAYLTSLITGARVPLSGMAQLKPEWQTSRIVRRNGVRTLTVRSMAREGVLPSTLLAAARPRIAALALPAGYRIEYGGEIENQNETFGEMVIALGVSVLAIFLILLFQFRTLTEPLLVMVSIPLSLFGAALGLVLTRNPFGFTAFVGLIGLTGVVVRNAIILIDYIRERRAAGETLERAALEAGERRLRPIFLTTMAAAVGVTPMIVSRSLLWSPLASVIAVGLICSMFFTLIVVPVLYVMVEGRFGRRAEVQS